MRPKRPARRTGRRADSPVRVGILIGSDTDLPIMAECVRVLDRLGVRSEVRILSAHRTPDEAAAYAAAARGRGIEVLVCGAGGAAHIAGVAAAKTTLPVVCVPMPTTALAGVDALYSIVQMPAGVPVATVAIGKPGATNAAILAAEILALGDPAVRAAIERERAALRRGVLAKDARLRAVGVEAYLKGAPR